MDRFNTIPGFDQAGAGAGSQRKRVRDSLFLMGRLTLPDDARQRDVRVRNLSECGLMIEYDRPLPIGGKVALAMRGIGDVTGVVAWCAEGRIGVALDHRINPRLARKRVGGGVSTPLYAKPQF